MEEKEQDILKLSPAEIQALVANSTFIAKYVLVNIEKKNHSKLSGPIDDGAKEKCTTADCFEKNCIVYRVWEWTLTKIQTLSMIRKWLKRKKQFAT